MKIKLTSVMVDDQDRAMAFYTGPLGFVLKHDVPLGEYKWLTVVSPDAPDGVELLLEPIGHPFARTFQKALFDAGSR
jgi:catechol 2,3-dioxygenase-like lactoylglutathione lyase family enzyme